MSWKDWLPIFILKKERNKKEREKVMTFSFLKEKTSYSNWFGFIVALTLPVV